MLEIINNLELAHYVVFKDTFQKWSKIVFGKHVKLTNKSIDIFLKDLFYLEASGNKDGLYLMDIVNNIDMNKKEIKYSYTLSSTHVGCLFLYFSIKNNKICFINDFKEINKKLC